jgi:hypothetical protein
MYNTIRNPVKKYLPLPDVHASFLQSLQANVGIVFSDKSSRQLPPTPLLNGLPVCQYYFKTTSQKNNERDRMVLL